jgi:hypothetical protein
MSSKIFCFEGAGKANHKPCDILHINGDRWVVESVDQLPHSYRLNLVPIEVFVASHNILAKTEYDDGITLQEYINLLCSEYEDSCCL